MNARPALNDHASCHYLPTCPAITDHFRPAITRHEKKDSTPRKTLRRNTLLEIALPQTATRCLKV